MNLIGFTLLENVRRKKYDQLGDIKDCFNIFHSKVNKIWILNVSSLE